MSDAGALLGWMLYSWQDSAPTGAVESVVPIRTLPQLQKELDRLRMERPQYIELVNPGVGALCLGVSSAVASVEWREGVDLRLIVRAVTSRVECIDSEIEFDAPGGGVQYEAEYLLPYALALRIILNCVEQGSFPCWALHESQRVGNLDIKEGGQS